MDDRFELFEIVGAFVDGERVDAAALKSALADPDGRDYFVDTWLLREGMQDDLPLESVTPAHARARAERRWPLLAVAASIVCLIGGGFAGYRLATDGQAPVDAAPIVEAPVPAKASFPVPPATRAIPVEFSADNSGTRGGD